jgi:hypothetical protein
MSIIIIIIIIIIIYYYVFLVVLEDMEITIDNQKVCCVRRTL